MGVSINASTGVLTVTYRAPTDGTVTVKAVCGSASNTCTVILKRYVPALYVSLNPSSLKLQLGGTATLTAAVYPANATNQSVIWYSSNTAVATVTNGVVTAVGPGITIIMAKTAGGSIPAFCRVTVAVSVTGVSLNTTSVALKRGGMVFLIATITPSNATNRGVIWTSSNSRVARVDISGMIIAVGKGTATITVTTKDGGYTATCKITVS